MKLSIAIAFFLLFPGRAPGQIPFADHTIAGAELSGGEPISVVAIDFDQDSDIDIVAASFYQNKITWFENDGTHHFIAHTITTNTIFVQQVFRTSSELLDSMTVMPVFSQKALS